MKRTQLDIYIDFVEAICKIYTEETGVPKDDIPYEDFDQICAAARYIVATIDTIDTLFGFLDYNSLNFKDSNNEKV